MAKDDIQILEAELQENPEYRAEWERQRPAYELARRMISLRTAAGLTQKDLAERAGLKQPDIARFESGVHMPNWSKLAAILAAMNVQAELRMKDANGRVVKIDLPLYVTKEAPASTRATTKVGARPVRGAHVASTD